MDQLATIEIQSSNKHPQEKFLSAAKYLNQAVGSLSPRARPKEFIEISLRLANCLVKSNQAQWAAEVLARASAAISYVINADEYEVAEAKKRVLASRVSSYQAICSINFGDYVGAVSHLEDGRYKEMKLHSFRNLVYRNLGNNDKARIDWLNSSLKELNEVVNRGGVSREASTLDDLKNYRSELASLYAKGAAIAGLSEFSSVNRFAEFDGDGIIVVYIILHQIISGVLVINTGSNSRQIDFVELDDGALRTCEALLTQYRDGYKSHHHSSIDNDVQDGNYLISIGDKLWRIFGERLVQLLDSWGFGNGGRLALIPQGMIATLPLGLAREPNTGTLLLDRYELSLVPSLAALEEKPEPTVPSLASIINPTEDLRFTELEGALVSNTFPTRSAERCEGGLANRAAVLALLDERSHWHFACHSAFNWKEPRDSGLILAGGETLTFRDLLEARRLTPPRLVALSACETGLHDVDGSPDEFLGLPAGFLDRGAKGVLATLWPVNDASTALFMHCFFDNHIRECRRPAAALKTAQAWLRSLTNSDLDELYEQLRVELVSVERTRLAPGSFDPSTAPAPDAPDYTPFSHPYYWAGFTVYGR